MRLVLALGTFPQIAEGWVIPQIDSLLRRGHELWVVTGELGVRPWHERIDELGLMARVSVRPRRGLRTGVPGRGLASQLGLLVSSGPRGWRLVNPLRHGRHAITGRTAFAHLGWLDAVRRFGRIDAVLAHHPWHGWDACKARQAGVFDAPILTWFHEPIAEDGSREFARLFRHGDAFVGASRFVARGVRAACAEVLGVDPDAAPVHVLPMGIDASRFAGRAVNRDDATPPLRLLCIGRLVEWKGQRYAIEAVAMLAERGVAATLELVGDGDQREALQRLAGSLGVADRVVFRGMLTGDGVAEAIGRAQVVLMPSVRTPGREEALGVAPMEAAAAGLPVIASSIGGLPEVVDHERTGLLVPQRDARSLSEAIAWLGEPARRRLLGEAAQRRCGELFDSSALARRLETLLDAVLAARVAGAARRAGDQPSSMTRSA